MSFKSPETLWLLLLITAAMFLFAYAARRRTEALRLFFGERDAPEQDYASSVARVRRLRGFLVVLGVALLVLALAGPLYGTSVREARQESLDLIIALDVSSSMLAEDVAPSRLFVARWLRGFRGRATIGVQCVAVFAGVSLVIVMFHRSEI